jgi:hypothetical protein
VQSRGDRAEDLRGLRRALLLDRLLARGAGLLGGVEVGAAQLERHPLQRLGPRRQQAQPVGGRELERGDEALGLGPDGLGEVRLVLDADRVPQRGQERPALLLEGDRDAGERDGPGDGQALGQVRARGVDHQVHQPGGGRDGEAGDDGRLGGGEVLLEEEALLGEAGGERVAAAGVLRAGHRGDQEASAEELLAEQRRGDLERLGGGGRGGHLGAAS